MICISLVGSPADRMVRGFASPPCDRFAFSTSGCSLAGTIGAEAAYLERSVGDCQEARSCPPEAGWTWPGDRRRPACHVRAWSRPGARASREGSAVDARAAAAGQLEDFRLVAIVVSPGVSSPGRRGRRRTPPQSGALAGQQAVDQTGGERVAAAYAVEDLQPSRWRGLDDAGSRDQAIAPSR